MMTRVTMINLTYNCSDGLDSININVTSVNIIGPSVPFVKILEIQNRNGNLGKVFTLQNKCMF